MKPNTEYNSKTYLFKVFYIINTNLTYQKQQHRNQCNYSYEGVMSANTWVWRKHHWWVEVNEMKFRL